MTLVRGLRRAASDLLDTSAGGRIWYQTLEGRLTLTANNIEPCMHVVDRVSSVDQSDQRLESVLRDIHESMLTCFHRRPE